jgi:hypothetical protein
MLLRGRSEHNGGHGPGVGCIPGRGALRSGGRRGSVRGSDGARIYCSALMLVSVFCALYFHFCGAQAFLQSLCIVSSTWLYIFFFGFS